MSESKHSQGNTSPVTLHHPYFYLSEAAANSLVRYEYKGVDHSFIYRYILSPFAQLLVDTLTPHWLAPNLITLTGLIFMILAYLITAFYYISNPTLDDIDEDFSTHAQRAIVPNWVFAFNAAAMLIYQTLDNMDGKQARKTHSSSPLGLLFDHGCDAINSMMGSQLWIAAMAISVTTHPVATFTCVMGPMVLFYISTWEEYHSGVLILPWFNGPTEGLLLGACTMIVSFLTHPMDFWHSYSIWQRFAPTTLNDRFGTLSNVDVLITITVFMTLREIVFKVIWVVYKYGIHSCLNLLPMISFASLTWVIGYTDPYLMERNFTLFLHLISALFVEMVTSMMLNHLTGEKYNYLRWVLVPYWILAGLVVRNHGSSSSSSTTMYGSTDHDMDIFVAVYTAMVIVYLLFKWRIIIHEMCMILGIYCFDIVTPLGPDYSAVQTVLGIFCFDTSSHTISPEVTNGNKNPTVVPSKEQGIAVQTGVPLEKKLL